MSRIWTLLHKEITDCIKLIEEDVLNIIILLTYYPFQFSITRIWMMATLIFHLLMVFIQFFTMIISFDTLLLSQYGPVMFLTFYGIVNGFLALTAGPISRKMITDIPKKLNMSKMSNKTANKIKNEGKHIVTIVCFAEFFCFVCIYSSPLTQHEAVYAFVFFDKYFPHYSTALVLVFYAGVPLLFFIGTALPVGFIFILTKLKFLLYHLQDEIESFNREVEGSDDYLLLRDQNYQNHVDEKLKICIRNHSNLQQFQFELHQLCKTGLVSLSTSGLVAIVNVLFYRSSNPSFSTYLLISFTTFILILFGFAGQELINESERIFDYVAAVPWTGWNVENRRNLLIFMMNSRKPRAIAISDSVTLNYEFLVQMCRLSFSINTVLSKKQK